ncbi:trefoil factor 1 [Mantella aurantiaca]
MDYRLFCLVAIAFVVSSFSTANGQAALIEEVCIVEPHERVNCGDPGISPIECFNKGCCFDKSDQHAIWCYYAKPNTECLKWS